MKSGRLYDPQRRGGRFAVGCATMHDRPLEYRPHPWHGVDPGKRFPEIVRAYIEIVPTDGVKYEIDKATGHLKIDRPQQYSNICPTPYGFIPQTLCAERVGALCALRTGRRGIVGDGDPMDICILTEKDIPHGNISSAADAHTTTVFFTPSSLTGSQSRLLLWRGR